MECLIDLPWPLISPFGGKRASEWHLASPALLMPPKRIISLSAPPSRDGFHEPLWTPEYRDAQVPYRKWCSTLGPPYRRALHPQFHKQQNEFWSEVGWIPRCGTSWYRKPAQCIKSGAPRLWDAKSLGKYPGLSEGIEGTQSLLSVWWTPSRSLPTSCWESPPMIAQLTHTHS